MGRFVALLLPFCLLFSGFAFGQVDRNSAAEEVEAGEESIFVMQFGDLFVDRKPFFSVNLTDTSQTQILPPVQIWNAGPSTLRFQQLGKMQGVSIQFPEKLLPGDTGTVQLSVTGKDMKVNEGLVSSRISGSVGVIAEKMEENRVLFAISGTIRHILSPEEREMQPQVLVETTRIDLGRVVMGDTISVEYKVKNVGKLPLTFGSVRTNSGHSIGRAIPKTLEPGASGVIRYEGYTNGRPGKMLKNFQVECNALSNPIFHLQLIYEVVEDPFRMQDGPRKMD